MIGDVEGWTGEGSDDKAHFVFRGEAKPRNVPDSPPVDLAASSSSDPIEGMEDHG